MEKRFNTYRDIRDVMGFTINSSHMLMRYVFEPIECARVWEDGARRSRKGFETLALINQMRLHIRGWRDDMGLALLEKAKPAAAGAE